MSEPTTTANKQPEKSLDKQQRGQRSLIRTISFVAGLAVLVSLIACGIGVLNWLMLKKNVTDQRSLLTGQKSTFARIVTQQQQLQQQIKMNKQQMVQVLQHQQRDVGDGWKIAAAHYLVQLASYNVDIQHNPQLAVKLLEAAKQQLAGLVGADVVHAAQAITNDIAALNAVPKVNLADILQRFIALETQISEMKLAQIDTATTTTKPTAKPEQTQTTTQAKSAIDWRSGLQSTWRTLEKLVIVRHHQQPINPLLSPQQQFYLAQNLHLLLQQAQWAALNQQQAIYKQTIEQAEVLIKRYYAYKEPAAASVLQELTKLGDIDVNPSLPTLTSLKVIDRLLHSPNTNSDTSTNIST